jgi:Dolichyl-phosphate-mannose-protein mannosyltransferase
VPAQRVSRLNRTHYRIWVIISLLLGLCLTGLLRFYHGSSDFTHVDEEIVSEVVKGLRARGDLDTNWILADLPDWFKIEQYNFSSYILTSLVWSHLFQATKEEDFRVFSAVCSTLTALPIFWIGLRARGFRVACLAVLLSAIAPILVQDAHYARPEAFVTLLTLTLVALVWPRKKVTARRQVIVGLIFGILVACKVSMLLIAFLPFVSLLIEISLRDSHKPLRADWRHIRNVTLGICAGFVTGCPGAIFHPGAFYRGFMNLMNQYSSVFFYYSHPDGGPVVDMLLAYLLATFGYLWMLAFIVGVLTTMRSWKLCKGRAMLLLLFLPALLTIGYFATKIAFFERNFSHVIPLCCIGAALGIDQFRFWLQRRSRLPRLLTHLVYLGAILGLCSTPVKVCRYFFHATDPIVITERKQREAIAIEKAQFSHTFHWQHSGCRFNREGERLAKDPSNRVGVVLYDYYDKASPIEYQIFHERYEAEELLQEETLFPGIPFCTLHVYHSPRRWYYRIINAKDSESDVPPKRYDSAKP